MTLLELIKELRSVKKEISDLTGDYQDLFSDSRGRETLEPSDRAEADKISAQLDALEQRKKEIVEQIRLNDSFDVFELADALVNEFNKSKIKKYNVETEIDKSTKIKGVKTPLIYVKSSKKDDENYFVGVKGSNRGLFDKKITLPNGEERDCICIVPSATYKQVKGKDNKQDLRFGEVVKTVFNKFAAEKIVDTNQNINHI